MRNLNAILIPLIGLLTVAFPVQAASFDCAKAGTKVEHMICDNPEISKLDEELAQSYNRIKGVSIALNLEEPCHVAHVLS